VRQTEAAVKRLSRRRTKADGSTLVTNDANIRAAEMKLKRLLGAQVSIRFGQSGGKMEISFSSVTDLDRIYSIIMSKTDTGSPLPTVL
jgi:hypothetical protein